MAQPIRRILVPTDFSEHAQRALEYALSLAERMGTSIDVLHVWEPPRYLESQLFVNVPGEGNTSLETLGLAHAGRILRSWLAPYHSRSVPLHAHLERGAAADTIVHFARQGYDLVVMGTHGRTGLSRLMMGSVAKKVVTLSQVPVLTVHREEEAAHPAG